MHKWAFPPHHFHDHEISNIVILMLTYVVYSQIRKDKTKHPLLSTSIHGGYIVLK
jgi:hypothetical protein